MPHATLDPADALPRTHLFLSFARGNSIRTVRLRVGVARASVGAISVLACWLVASSLYLVFHDDLVATLMAREAATQYAYEDRIAALRSQVERESSLKLVGQTTLDGKLRELAARATALEERASLLAQVSARTGVQPGEHLTGAAVTTPSATGPTVLDNPVDMSPTGSVDHPRGAATADKPHLDVESRNETRSMSVRVAGVEERLERIDAAQYRALAAVGTEARRKVGLLRAAFESAGLDEDRVVTPLPAGATGGPFVPLDPAITHSAFGQALDAMRSDLVAAGGLIRALPRVPFATPLKGALEVTSPFGARLDPFLGRPAMHTGVDLADGYGTDVRATATGRVTAAGPAGGYGNMVEIDHGHGLSTRYAHLSAIEVSIGQVVDKGEVIAEVGATGRATGPHLHYETRIDGEPVDPVRFLNAGLRLAALDTPR